MVQEMDECVKNMLSAVGLGRVRGGWMWWCCDLLNLGMAEGVYVYWVHEVVAGAQRLFPGRVSGLLVRYYDGLLLGDSSV